MNEPDDPRDDEPTEDEVDGEEDLDSVADHAKLEETFAEEEEESLATPPEPAQGGLFDHEVIPTPEHRHYATDAQERRHHEERHEEPRYEESRHEEHRHEPHRSARKSGFESLLRDSFKKAVERGLEAGLGTLKSADTVVRNVVEEVKAPKDVTGYLFSQIDETKNVLIRAVAHEVREFLDATDLATELQRALTALSFEVKMEIRFIPNEAGELQPKVRAKAAPKTNRKDGKRPSARRREDEAED